jgi:hypothetical protein
MTDIVERLNRGEGCLEEGGKTCISMDAESGCLCAIAADEITRLRAEVERMREALEKIGGIKGAYSAPWPERQEGYSSFAVVTARAAHTAQEKTDD